MVQGDTFEVKRVFTNADVERFVEMSGDRNHQHVTPDEKGRVVVHGLLTATMPSIIGGELSVNAREFRIEWFKPVYTGDELVCKITVDKLEHRPSRMKITALFEIFNQLEERVASGHFFGLIAV